MRTLTPARAQIRYVRLVNDPLACQRSIRYLVCMHTTTEADKQDASRASGLPGDRADVVDRIRGSLDAQAAEVETRRLAEVRANWRGHQERDAE